VTIEGESAGGGSVGSLLTSPLGKGLFHQAMLESTYALWHPQYTLAQAEASFASAFSLYSESIATLRSLPAAALVAAQPPDEILGDGHTNLYDPTNYGPIVDGYYQKDTSLNLWRNHQFTVSNILIGTCDNEGYIFTSEPIFGSGYPQYETNPTFQAYLEQQYGTLGAQALADYPVSAPTDALSQLGYAFGDTWFGYGTRQIARAEEAAGANVYRYVLTRQPADATSPETHGCEVDFVWPGATIDTTPTDTGAATYQALFQDTFSRFIKTGNPNGGAVSNWPAFGSDDGYLDIANSGNLPMTEYRQAPLDLVDQYSSANLP
jgi:para-nitrobenzyl esterase